MDAGSRLGDRLASQALLDGLTDAQARAVLSEASPLVVLASAGAGKTRVLTRRIAYRSLTGRCDPARVLALTFTRKAAGELAARLHYLGLRDRVATGTFHAVAAAQLRRWWADRGEVAPVILDRRARLIGPLADARPALAGVPLGELIGHLDWVRARQLGPVGLARAAADGGHPLPFPAEELVALMTRYEHEKRRRGLVDFDDLLQRCAEAIEADPAFAAAQRWRWRHVHVDEFQDVNPLQHRLLSAWLGDSSDLCVVGDPDQAIYGWNGADPQLLDALPRRWPGAEVVRLDANHRCTPQIVAAAACALGPRPARLVSSRPDGDPVTVTAHETDAAEAAAVASELRASHRLGSRWSTMAVLARTNTQAVLLADACRSAGIPVRVPGQAELLDQPVARAALSELCRQPAVAIAVAVHDLRRWAAGEAFPGRPASGERTGHLPGDEEDAATLAALAELAAEAGRLDESITAGGWAATLPALLRGDDGPGPADTVTVCSFHRSKGLEWSEVWVCGLEDGLVPISRAATRAAREEERRLLYVALTRGADRVHCSWARRRRFGAILMARTPSPWLPDSCDAAAPEPTPSREEWQERVAASRRRLGARGRPAGRRRNLPPGWPEPDEALLERLTTWRSAAARAAAVPAHVVLHDATLVALASARPSDEAQLLAVPGVGPVKASRYGGTLLPLLRQDS